MIMGMARRCLHACALAMAAAAADPTAAHALSADDLMGRWCGDNIDSVFTTNELTVTFLNTKNRRVLHIKQINVAKDTIEVIWEAADGGKTTYGEFTGRRMVMLPQTAGDKGPRREFHRC
jgi:hypothetical protein